jgi:hypothetical protein
MIGIYTFNENTAANVYDYSGNGNDATSISNFAIVAGELGYAGSFNGTTTDLNFGNIANVTGTLSIFCKLKVTTGAAQIICYKSNHFTLGINASDKVTFTIASGGSTWTITSSTSIVNDTWTTIGAVYDGSDMYIYLDGVEDVTNAQTGSFTASASDFHIGTDTTTYLNGRIEMIELNTLPYNVKNILAVHNNPTGLKYETYRKHGFELGDLLESDLFNTNRQGIVTYYDTQKIFYVKPIKGKFNIGDNIIRRGNIYDVDRQWIFDQRIVSDKPYIFMTDGVNAFDSDTPDASSVVDLSGNTTRGFLPPKMTTTQRNAISSPAIGLMIYNTTTSQWEGWNGSWTKLG